MKIHIHRQVKCLRNWGKIIRSFNNNWEVTYSDGGSSYGLRHFIFDVTRCSNCCEIILGVQDIPLLKTATKVPFWKRRLHKRKDIYYLPHPTSDVYLELFEHSTNADDKMSYALSAYRLFNQIHHLENKNTQPSEITLRQYLKATEHILASPPKYHMPEYDLLCADIYRLQGQFDKALQTYRNVNEEKYLHIVEQGVVWVSNKQRLLMIIRAKTHDYEDKSRSIVAT
ncbi:hypothetical protein [Paraglaciecola sp. L1A13]|uniref:hypothetical protein n=1 Tax=Paraglaciecola sp. L1A13 TaxID=2686359 RepID=UPI00131BE398|nr:hypothetical protein [Paraglaciecola sp. L1A13]